MAATQQRILYLLRHAKSSWDDDRLDDHDRPLAKRGEQAVERLRRHVEATAIAPDLVLCSSARRTVMTLDGIAPALPTDVEVRVEVNLYSASAGQLLARLQHVDGGVTALLLIGHNPGTETLAAGLTGGGDDALRRRMETKFPTGALATLTFEGAWSELTPGHATLRAFVVPKEL